MAINVDRVQRVAAHSATAHAGTDTQPDEKANAAHDLGARASQST